MTLTNHVNLRLRMLLFLAVLLGLILACGGNDPEINSTTTITVFEDNNDDGQMGTGEAPIPNALIVTSHNRLGYGARISSFTDQSGQVTVSVVYTHYFEIEVATPCGYRAVSDTKQSAVDQPKLFFGFTPEKPHSRTATVIFHLWNDLDGDGLFDGDEPPISGTDLVVEPWQPGNHSHWEGPLALTTDEGGWGMLELGNSCGTFWVRVPNKWVNTSSVPVSIDKRSVYKAVWLAYSYDLGTMEIEWGLRKSVTPTAPPTGATP
jgi:hypothetical protein